MDDDVDTCRNLADISTDLSYQVDTAHDGPSGLEKAPWEVAIKVKPQEARY